MSSQGSISAERESSDVHLLLEQWGRWVRTERVTLGGNSMFKLGSTVPTPMITDDEALRVDGIIARLKHRRPDMGKCLKLYYADGLGCDRKVGKAMRVSTQSARGTRRAAVAWVDGILHADI
jgi:hypothetical protein